MKLQADNILQASAASQAAAFMAAQQGFAAISNSNNSQLCACGNSTPYRTICFKWAALARLPWYLLNIQHLVLKLRHFAA
jgi:hypothetical protein